MILCDTDIRGLLQHRTSGRNGRFSVPSAFLLHGYVGLIFGSVKANPWWSSVLIPIIFLFSAIVSGIAIVMIIYYFASMFRLGGPEGLLVTLGLLALPFLILWVLVKLLPPWEDAKPAEPEP